MWEKIVAFFMSIIAFFSSLFGFGGTDANTDYVFKNLSYGSHKRQVLDLRIPENSDGEVGLVLIIHGGGWISRDKEGTEAALKTCCNDLRGILRSPIFGNFNISRLFYYIRISSNGHIQSSVSRID